jgi:outer membrane protein OmpA-like peptidoglycan-associated protein
MSGHRFSPWPAYVDLFSGLVVLMFAVIVIDVVRAKQSPVQKMAEEVLASVKKDLGDSANQCSDQDLCVNVSINFDTGKDIIKGYDDIKRVADVLLKALNEQQRKNPKLDTKLVQIVVEGHTDSRVRDNLTGRARFVFNWNLSAQRASSVMYALDQYGLGSRNGYNVVSLGLANSDDVCHAQRDVLCTPEDVECRRRVDAAAAGPDPCDDKNRRTTIRMIFDYKAAGATAANGHQPTVHHTSP